MSLHLRLWLTHVGSKRKINISEPDGSGAVIGIGLALQVEIGATRWEISKATFLGSKYHSLS